MTKIHKIKISIVANNWDQVEIATGSIEIDRHGNITDHSLHNIPMHRLFMFKPETALNIIIGEGEEKKEEN